MKVGHTELRFGILVDSETLELWQVNTIRHLIDHGIKLCLVVQHDRQESSSSFLKRLKSYPYRRALFQIWNHYLFNPACKQSTPITTLTDGVPRLLCRPIQKGVSTYLTDDDVTAIRSYRLDFLLRFGFNILRGDVLESARYGIWSFHHGDEMRFRGGPPGFWEFMQGEPINGVILQRLTSALDKGFILKKWHLPTIRHSYKEHLNQLYFQSELMPLQVCENISSKGTISEYESQSNAKIYHAPYNITMMRYWLKCVWRRVAFHIHDIFCQEDWNIGVIPVGINEFISSHNIIDDKTVLWKKKNKRHEYFADPFILSTARDTYVFFEWYDYSQGKGVLALSRKSENFEQNHVILAEYFHLSFPHIFEYDGSYYCIPEQNQSGHLDLYVFDEDSLTLRRECVLLEGMRVVDPIVYHDDKLWHLLFTQKEHPSTKLYHYTASSLRGPYIESGSNPTKVDVSSARSAGALIQHEEMLLRPAQNCVGAYGKSVSLMKISELSENYHVEEQWNTLSPRINTPYNQGLHTINGNSSYTVFDGKRYVFTWHGMIQQIRQKIKK